MFSGEPNCPKGVVPFDQWSYEVSCLHKDTVKLQSIRRSLRGEANRTDKRLGAEATLKKLMDKLNSNYDIVEATEYLLASFYSSKQKFRGCYCMGRQIGGCFNKIRTIRTYSVQSVTGNVKN